ncbi:MAG: response regulator [Planctomycetota bacterium]
MAEDRSTTPEGAGTETSPVPMPQDDVDFGQAHVLVVDDNPQNIELLEAYLDALPCSVVSTTNGIEALEIVHQQPQPDIVLLDVMMPKMSGFEVCRKMKADPTTRDIPVIMVTALNEVGDVERGVESGTDDFLSKPFNKLELLTRVKSLLRMRLLKRKLDEYVPQHQRDMDRRANVDEQTRVED